MLFVIGEVLDLMPSSDIAIGHVPNTAGVGERVAGHDSRTADNVLVRLDNVTKSYLEGGQTRAVLQGVSAGLIGVEIDGFVRR